MVPSSTLCQAPVASRNRTPSAARAAGRSRATQRFLRPAPPAVASFAGASGGTPEGAGEGSGLRGAGAETGRSPRCREMSSAPRTTAGPRNHLQASVTAQNGTGAAGEHENRNTTAVTAAPRWRPPLPGERSVRQQELILPRNQVRRCARVASSRASEAETMSACGADVATARSTEQYAERAEAPAAAVSAHASLWTGIPN